jgi:hypothetical protein
MLFHRLESANFELQLMPYARCNPLLLIILCVYPKPQSRQAVALRALKILPQQIRIFQWMKLRRGAGLAEEWETGQESPRYPKIQRFSATKKTCSSSAAPLSEAGLASYYQHCHVIATIDYVSS